MVCGENITIIIPVGCSGCQCPCSRRSTKLEGPLITVSYRSSYYGDWESYYIKTDEMGPTTFYARPVEDNDNIEFTFARNVAPEGQINKPRNVTFKSPERERQVLGQQPVCPNSGAFRSMTYTI